MDVSSKGADDLARLSRQLKEAGEKGLQRELAKAIRDAVKPLRTTKLAQSALATLPKRNGVNKLIAKSKYSLSRKTGPRVAGLKLTARNEYDLYRIDRGILRHPVFKRKGEEGRNAVWQAQKVNPGWFTKPAEAAAPNIQAEIKKAMDRIVAQITKGL